MKSCIEDVTEHVGEAVKTDMEKLSDGITDSWIVREVKDLFAASGEKVRSAWHVCRAMQLFSKKPNDLSFTELGTCGYFHFLDIEDAIFFIFKK